MEGEGPRGPWRVTLEVGEVEGPRGPWGVWRAGGGAWSWLCRSPRTVCSSCSVADSLALRVLATIPTALVSTAFSMLVLTALISYSVRVMC